MTNQRIIYPAPDGGIAVVIPAQDCSLTVDQIAQKDVPAGVPYLLVTADDIPTDRTFRDAWDADFSQPDGQGMGADAWFIAQTPQEPEE
jgi:hypothetical protein